MKNIDRKKLKKFILWFLFLSTFGVAGGITFLFSVIVPYEQYLSDQGTSQRKIDGILKYFVIGWVLFGFFVSFLYYRFLLRKKERFIPAAIIAFLTTIAAGTVTYLFFSANSTVVIASQGDVEVVGERFTFGPYPTMEDLERLKEEGYDGVITLLSPANPIEVPPLEKEKVNAEKAGITLHHYPMLPWVGDNKESIEGIKALVNEDDQKRYYVHCYLGRHRAGLVQEMIEAETGLEIGDETLLQTTDFERGYVFHFQNQQIMLGPYPTDEEWLTYVARGGVKEVISLLDPNSSTFKEEQEFVSDFNMTLTSMPISSNPTAEELQKVVDYANSLDHNVYIHDFNSSERIYALEAMFSLNKTPIIETKLTNDLQENGLFIGRKILLGDAPPSSVLSSLKNAGIQSAALLTENTQQIPAPTNMPVYEQKLSSNQTEAELYKAAKGILNLEGPVYVYHYDKELLTQLHSLLTHLSYGFSDEDFEQHFNQDAFAYIERNYVIGPLLSEQEWQETILKNGFRDVILLYSISLIGEGELANQRKIAETFGVNIDVIPIEEGYKNKLTARLNKQNESLYIMVPSSMQTELVGTFSNY